MVLLDERQKCLGDFALGRFVIRSATPPRLAAKFLKRAVGEWRDDLGRVRLRPRILQRREREVGHRRAPAQYAVTPFAHLAVVERRKYPVVFSLKPHFARIALEA